MRQPYVQASEITYEDEPWAFPATSLARARIEAPREYRQLLSTLLNGLTARGFVLIGMREETGHEPSEDPSPGEWDHFTSILPPWISFLARLMPEVFLSECKPSRGPDVGGDPESPTLMTNSPTVSIATHAPKRSTLRN
jgi:hypothetical protein